MRFAFPPYVLLKWLVSIASFKNVFVWMKMTERLKMLAESYLDHILIAVKVSDRVAPFRDFFDNWNAFRSDADHHRTRGEGVRWFNNPIATKRMAMLKSLDFISTGAADILHQSRSNPAEYIRRYRDKDANIRLIVDHAVPIGVIRDMLFDLQSQQQTELSRESIRDQLVRWYRLGLISYTENSKLNSTKLGKEMPSGWDGVDPFARYRAAGIHSSPAEFGLSSL